MQVRLSSKFWTRGLLSNREPRTHLVLVVWTGSGLLGFCRKRQTQENLLSPCTFSSTNKAHQNRNSATEHRVEPEDKSSAQERKRGTPPPPPWLSAKDPFQEGRDMFQGTLGNIPFLIRGLMHWDGQGSFVCSSMACRWLMLLSAECEP